MKINLLPESLANKIAAGEVVERPASVIKELVENSIDAQSTFIKIELTEAGLVEIKVTDNGEGMAEADCKRAFLRHATSKIKYDADLFHIKSLGFRGEALASIASVSKLTIATSDGTEAGTKLYLEAGEVIEEAKSDARKGTKISVRELFYNTPARLKYIKSIHTELGHITDLINRYALGHPHIRFELYHNGKKLFATTGSNNKLQVIGQIYGMEVAKQMMQTKAETNDFYIEAFVGKPEVTRANRKFITLIVNGRYIRNYALTQAIIRGYDTLLPIHRFPIVVMYIELDPILVDVNVHPTKLEVRFSKEQELVQTVEQMIRSLFKQMTLIPSITKQKPARLKSTQAEFAFQLNEKVREKQEQKPTYEDFFTASLKHENKRPNEASERTIVDEEFETTEIIEKFAPNIEAHNATLENERMPMMYPIGQLQGTYILAQNERGFYMIDQHAAQERIKYEFFKKKLNEPQQADQHLLMPLTFDFTMDELIYIEKYKEHLAQFGILLEPFGGQTYAVRTHPTWFPKGLEEEIIRDIIAQVIKEGTIHIGKLRDEIAQLMACKRSIKANHHLELHEMERLLEDLRKTEDPFTCPHGRPVIVHFTYYEIEKMFKRVM